MRFLLPDRAIVFKLLKKNNKHTALTLNHLVHIKLQYNTFPEKSLFSFITNARSLRIYLARSISLDVSIQFMPEGRDESPQNDSNWRKLCAKRAKKTWNQIRLITIFNRWFQYKLMRWPHSNAVKRKRFCLTFLSCLYHSVRTHFRFEIHFDSI